MLLFTIDVVTKVDFYTCSYITVAIIQVYCEVISSNSDYVKS